MAHQTGILDLPVELLLLVFEDLDVRSFLNLTSTCKALHAPNILYEPSYWSNLVRTTFRVPNQPVLAHDGARWHKLYRRLRTQSRVYLWGNNDRGSLAVTFTHSRAEDFLFPGRHRLRQYAGFRRSLMSSWPEPMRDVKELGIISDLQCGGWSTTLLTAKGAIYTAGVIDGVGHQTPADGPVPLLYPPGFTSPVDRYEPSTAIKQMSVGRSHVLALSDSGKIWSWRDANRTALNVKFLHHELADNGKTKGKGVVEKVVAGWNKSAALIQGVGIVLWEQLQRDNNDTSFADAALVMQSEVVPNSSFRANDAKMARSDSRNDSASAAVGEVSNFIVLENILLFATHIGKVFVSQLHWDGAERHITEPLELPIPTEQDDEPTFVTDVQGSFQTFAVFTKSGAVLIGKQGDLLDYIQQRSPDRTLLTRIPALQHKDVIQLAFGDYHFHALHAPGYITSYGKEPQHCGAFGLGNDVEGTLRGMIGLAESDSHLVPHAYSEGRRIWFQREKKAWLSFLALGGADEEESKERREALSQDSARARPPLGNCDWPGELSEWIEQEARDWEANLGLQHANEDGLGSHFALSVTAAGWHSGALVLVNEDLEAKIRDACEVPDPLLPPAASTSQSSDVETIDSAPSLVDSAMNVAADYGRRFLGLRPPRPPNAPVPRGDGQNQGDRSPNGQFASTVRGSAPRPGMQYTWHGDHFPRLVLSNGREMPGTVPFDRWRNGRPEWDLSVSL